MNKITPQDMIKIARKSRLNCIAKADRLLNFFVKRIDKGLYRAAKKGETYYDYDIKFLCFWLWVGPITRMDLLNQLEKVYKDRGFNAFVSHYNEYIHIEVVERPEGG